MNERNGAGMLTYIPTSELYAHPDNPRKDLGDLTELAESIKANVEHEKGSCNSCAGKVEKEVSGLFGGEITWQEAQ